MTTDRKNGIFSGIFFILATITYMTASSMLPASVEIPNYLAQLPSNKTHLLLAVCCELINDMSVVGIGILMFRLLKPYSEDAALAYFSIRSIEGAVLFVSSVSPLLLIPISDAIGKATTTDLSFYHTLGVLAMKWHYYTFQIALLATGFSGIVLCYLLFVKKITARWMSVLGLVGYVAIFVKTFADFFGYEGGTIVYMPGALFELIFPILLIVKGLKTVEEK